jgi:hypothetical protein
MKFPLTNRVGLSTAGLTGNMILAGIIFADLSAWWLIASALLILSSIGTETRGS